jgi:hypothetical protein
MLNVVAREADRDQVVQALGEHAVVREMVNVDRRRLVAQSAPSRVAPHDPGFFAGDRLRVRSWPLQKTRLSLARVLPEVIVMT